ncbi:MAG: RagB/SusD family nutrient uptake outer membrane protein [Bacteroidales bacterium]|nr:RagB/SusD family nutrient uptake outer membrane protein [Bacteroidales bacterium]MCB9013599.1 RagB/SusD family nutrient uptake outer membrane protein [Bacteroidales bacterium]
MEKIFRIKPYFLLIIIASLLATYGCSDEFFTEQAGDRITPDEHYKTIRDAERSLEGVMKPLQDFMPKLIILDGLRSDMMNVTDFADLDMKELNDQTISLQNTYTDVADLYKVIINCNEVFLNIDNVAKTDRNYDEVIQVSVKKGLVALRSWAYLTLLKINGEAAYFEDNMVSIPAPLAQNVMSRDALLDTLISQNLYYLELFNQGIEKVEIKLFQYPNTKAILGELYLEKNDYANAAAYLKLACESYGNVRTIYKVDRTFIDKSWKNIFVAAESNDGENLSVIPFASTQAQVNPVTQWTLYNDQYKVKPTQVLIDSFMNQIPLAGATLGDQYRGLGITYDTVASGEAYIKKYAIDEGEPYSSDIIISRAADLHLLLAEALNRLGDQTTALTLLNSGFNSVNPRPAAYSVWSDNRGIRGRAYLKAREIPVDFTGDPMILVEDWIMEERAMELAYEGKRWFDLVRVANRRGTPEYLADRVAAKFGVGTAKYNAVHDILMNPANWYLPLH